MSEPEPEVPAERSLSSYGRPGGSEYAVRFDEDGKRILFCGPWGRIKAQLTRGKIARDLEIGLRAMQFPANLNRLRDSWEFSYDEDRWLLAFVSPRGYVATLRFFAPVPKQLREALADVFTHHRPAGSRAAKRRADGQRARSMVQSPATQTGGFIQKYRRMKAEAPEKFAALLTKARAVITRQPSAAKETR